MRFPSGLLTRPTIPTQKLWVVWQAAQESSDPTGMIACPAPCEVRYAAAYSFCIRDLTRYAASWEEQGDSISFVLEHEFEKQILAALGYSLRWR
jgi:hypothetical protein